MLIYDILYEDFVFNKMAATVCVLFAAVVQASEHGSGDESARNFQGISLMESASEENDLTHTLYYTLLHDSKNSSSSGPPTLI